MLLIDVLKKNAIINEKGGYMLVTRVQSTNLPKCMVKNASTKASEAAKKLGCPLGTIKSRIYNAKKELAEKLKDLL